MAPSKQHSRPSKGKEVVVELGEESHHIASKVKDFCPRYWGGVVVHDKEKEFFKALGGGKLLKESFLAGFLFNPRSMSNYKRAKATGLEGNLKGEGEVKG